MKQVSEIFAKRARLRLEELQWTQEKLAEKIGVSRGTVANYLQGETAPGADMLIKWADALEVSVQWLLGREELGAPRSINPKPEDIVKSLIEKFEFDEHRKSVCLLALTAEPKVFNSVYGALGPWLPKVESNASNHKKPITG
jgi:transcriptional regulator with XRE-family HTH domain